jgi:hypothetical protein
LINSKIKRAKLKEDSKTQLDLGSGTRLFQSPTPKHVSLSRRSESLMQTTASPDRATDQVSSFSMKKVTRSKEITKKMTMKQRSILARTKTHSMLATIQRRMKSISMS